VFQSFHLIPTMTALENIAVPLELAGIEDAHVRAARELAAVGLAERRDHYPAELSGGEQQRVALARAVAPRPRLLMLDEPLGALDRALRERLLDELVAILRRLRQTAIYVTHDQDEAFALADRIIILREGGVAQAGAPAEVYAAPATRFVAEFLGLKNILPGVVQREAGRATALTAVGQVPIGDQSLPAGAPVEVVLRPDGARLAEAGPNGTGGIKLEGRIVEKSFRGNRNLAVVEVGDTRLSFSFPAGQVLPAAGENLRLYLGPAAIHVMPAGGDQPAAKEQTRA
jgi:ABC-type Fe3+/spermidine/putrescine transport system ATPase subunit